MVTMGRHKATPKIHDALPAPRRPDGISEAAVEWWDGIVAARPGAISPHEAVILKMGCDWITLHTEWVARLRGENQLRGMPVQQEALVRNLTASTANVLRIAAEMGMTPKSRKNVAVTKAVEKKAAAPKTSLDDLRPSAMPTFGAKNGTHE